MILGKIQKNIIYKYNILLLISLVHVPTNFSVSESSAFKEYIYISNKKFINGEYVEINLLHLLVQDIILTMIAIGFIMIFQPIYILEANKTTKNLELLKMKIKEINEED